MSEPEGVERRARAPFEQIAHSTIRARGISLRAKLLWMDLSIYSGLPNGAHPARASLAADLECSEDSIDRALRELQEAGMLRIEHRPNQTSIYVLEAFEPKPREPQPCGPQPPQGCGAKETYKETESVGEVPANGSPQLTLVPDPEAEKGKGSDYRFEEAWQAYPRRNGVRVGKKEAREQWRKLSYADKGLCWKAIHIFAASKPELPPDMVRWLKHERWRDWLDRDPSPKPPAGLAEPTMSRAEWLMSNKHPAEMSEEERRICYRDLPEDQVLLFESRLRAYRPRPSAGG